MGVPSGFCRHGSRRDGTLPRRLEKPRSPECRADATKLVSSTAGPTHTSGMASTCSWKAGRAAIAANQRSTLLIAYRAGWNCRWRKARSDWTESLLIRTAGVSPAVRKTMTRHWSGARQLQPPLAPAVVLDVAERAAAFAADAEIEFLDVLVFAQRRGVAVEHHAAVLQDVAVMGVAQRHVGVLLGQQDRDLLALVEVLDDLEDLLDELRRQAHRRLVEQDGGGPAHQGAADRRHLLLAARGVASLAGAPVPEPREVVVDLLEVVGDLAALAAVDESAGQQVLLDREMAEAMAALHHL